jgi:ABC-type Fe3+ transport system substrate-binding protein
MDLQMDLVRQGHARPLRSANTQALPDWARHQDLAFCTTLEPLVSLRNSQHLGPSDAISTLQEIADLMRQRPDLLRQRMACLDIEANGMGFLAMLVARAQDPGYARFMDFAAGMGLQGHGANPPLVQALVSEGAVLAFPVLGAFAMRALASHPQLAVCTSPAPRLGVSRVALIPKAAPHPEIAACFVDFLLSSEGQHCMRQDGLFPWQDQGHSDGLPTLVVQPLPIDDGFGSWLDPQARSALRQDWARLLLA